jgi:hypothetical protein
MPLIAGRETRGIHHYGRFDRPVLVTPGAIRTRRRSVVEALSRSCAGSPLHLLRLRSAGPSPRHDSSSSEASWMTADTDAEHNRAVSAAAYASVPVQRGARGAALRGTALCISSSHACDRLGPTMRLAATLGRCPRGRQPKQEPLLGELSRQENDRIQMLASAATSTAQPAPWALPAGTAGVPT